MNLCVIYSYTMLCSSNLGNSRNLGCIATAYVKGKVTSLGSTEGSPLPQPPLAHTGTWNLAHGAILWNPGTVQKPRCSVSLLKSPPSCPLTPFKDPDLDSADLENALILVLDLWVGSWGPCRDTAVSSLSLIMSYVHHTHLGPNLLVKSLSSHFRISFICSSVILTQSLFGLLSAWGLRESQPTSKWCSFIIST